MPAKSYRGAKHVPCGPIGFSRESPMAESRTVRVTAPWSGTGYTAKPPVSKRATKFKKGSQLHRTDLSPEQIANRVRFGY